jgi:XTP/dITP diphosphohydrolase
MTRSASLVLASANSGKLAEFREMFAPLGINVRSQGDFGIQAAPEPHLTFIENALLKARHASRLSGLPALADDSGICVAALGGAPGVHSARFSELAGGAAGDAANNRLLIERLGASQDRSAYYYCVLVLVRALDDPQPLIADGRWSGEVVAIPRGQGGFGYDGHFFLPAQGRCVAELSRSEKNSLSHRGRALQNLVQQLREHAL